MATITALTILPIILIFLQLAACQLHPISPTEIPANNPKKLTFNASDLADKVILETRNQILRLGLDNIHTPDVNFWFKNYVVTVANGSIKGLESIQRVGDVLVTQGSFGVIKISSAFSVTNVTADNDVDLISDGVQFNEGLVHTDVDNVTVYQVFGYEILSETLTLDEFKLSLGDVNFSVTGLGEEAQKDSALIATIIRRTKAPVLLVFNIVFRAAVNAALAVVKQSLVG